MRRVAAICLVVLFVTSCAAVEKNPEVFFKLAHGAVEGSVRGGHEVATDKTAFISAIKHYSAAGIAVMRKASPLPTPLNLATSTKRLVEIKLLNEDPLALMYVETAVQALFLALAELEVDVNEPISPIVELFLLDSLKTMNEVAELLEAGG